MNPRIPLVLVLLTAFAWCPAAGKKYKLYLVNFHIEADQGDNPKFVTPVKLGSEHRQYYFSKLPVFTDADIEWFYPFTAQDGVSYGAAFRLKDHATQELHALTLQHQGKLMGMRASDAPLQAVLIDRPIQDGVVVFWSGLQQRHLQEFRKRFPHVDDLGGGSGPEFELPGIPGRQGD